MNPFSVFFAARYFAEDDPRFLKYLARGRGEGEGGEVDTFATYCLDNLHAPRLAPNTYAEVRFQISKRETKGAWTFETKTYETHYIRLAYFGEEGLGLSIEDYVDVAASRSGVLRFKRTNKHPLYVPIHLQISRTLTYIIQVLEICYYGTFAIPSSPVSSLVGYTDYLLMSPPLLPGSEERMVQETDPMLWC